ncbi:MAG: hypothetical protein JNM07_15570, partial [Phycisphaerae bacterium]|nr:hypothetical protein [Phycisphaerae bacterium]
SVRWRAASRHAVQRSTAADQARDHAGRCRRIAAGGTSTAAASARGRTLGIVGHGQLGQAVGAVGRAFGMRVIAARSLRQGPAGGHPPDAVQVDRLELKELLPVADVVSLHCPLTPATRQLINRESLARMRRDAVLINTARGDLVDTGALLEALQAGRLGGAGIDVLAEEPPVSG